MSNQILIDPQAPTEETRSITVQAITITLVVDRPWARVGETVIFSGTVLLDDAPWPGQTVELFIHEPLGGKPLLPIGTTTTDTDGNFAFSWTVPFSIIHEYTEHILPCKYFYAYAYSGGESNIGVPLDIAYTTRIVNFSAPNTIPAGDLFLVSGYLQMETEPGVWTPIANKSVDFLYNGTFSVSAITQIDGYFGTNVSIPDSGIYILKAYYAGEGLRIVKATRTLRVALGACPVCGTKLPKTPLGIEVKCPSCGFTSAWIR